MREKFWAIIPAAGTGKRFGSVIPKQYLSLHGEPIIAQSIHPFLIHPNIQKTVVVIAENDPHWDQLCHLFPAEKVMTVVGGAKRQVSVYQGLLALKIFANANDWVLVHDAVRPHLRTQQIDHLIETLQHHPVGGVLGVPVRDTLKRTNTQGEIINTINRTHVWQAQTPQMFRYGLLCEALQKILTEKIEITDEAAAMEYAGYQPLMVEGSKNNIKITFSEDIQ